MFGCLSHGLLIKFHTSMSVPALYVLRSPHGSTLRWWGNVYLANRFSRSDTVGLPEGPNPDNRNPKTGTSFHNSGDENLKNNFAMQGQLISCGRQLDPCFLCITGNSQASSGVIGSLFSPFSVFLAALLGALTSIIYRTDHMCF